MLVSMLLYLFVGPNHGGFGGFREVVGSSGVCALRARAVGSDLKQTLRSWAVLWR